jgi:hypothetical protein
MFVWPVMDLKANVVQSLTRGSVPHTLLSGITHTSPFPVCLSCPKGLQADGSVGPVHLNGFLPNLWNSI